MYNLNFRGLCQKLHIEEPVFPPEQVWGGLLHRMYRMQSGAHCYAVKALNPEVMRRETAIPNILLSERIASLSKSRGVPAVTAILIAGECIYEVDGQYYMVFPWVEGKPLRLEQVRPEHCRKVGEMLAKIHMLPFSLEGIRAVDRTSVPMDWLSYAREGMRAGTCWAQAMQQRIEKLRLWERLAGAAGSVLRSRMVPGHRDLDIKNILWQEGSPAIIDWEAAGAVNPAQELLDVALNWSGAEVGLANGETFCAVIEGYRNGGGRMEESWSAMLFLQYRERLAWLEYNLKRSVGVEYDEEERQLGGKEVEQTLRALERYQENMPTYLKWLWQGTD